MYCDSKRESYFILSCLQLEHLGRKQKLYFPLTERDETQVISKRGVGAVVQGSDLQQGAELKTAFIGDVGKNNCLGMK